METGFEILRSPWENRFTNLLNRSVNHVYLASPFVKLQTASLVTKNLPHDVDFRYINCFKLAHFHSGASDLAALKLFNDHNCLQRSVQNLHAKLFIFDDTAIITSGNLTPGGLRNNLEYGILIQNEVVGEIKKDYLNIFNNPEYPEITNNVIEKARNILISVPKEKRKDIRIPESTLFEDIINDENVNERFDGGISSIVSNLSPWEKDVFECLLKINNDIFSLNEIYTFESDFQKRHPNNRNIQAKIRQQLQYLRDVGLLEFLQPGTYKKLWVQDDVSS